MDKNKKEKELIQEWGIKNQNNSYFQVIDKSADSYFSKIDHANYLREYGFLTLPELRAELDALWTNDEIMDQIKKIAGVAALKNKPVKISNEESKSETKETERKLSAFIYEF